MSKNSLILVALAGLGTIVSLTARPVSTTATAEVAAIWGKTITLTDGTRTLNDFRQLLCYATDIHHSSGAKIDLP